MYFADAIGLAVGTVIGAGIVILTCIVSARQKMRRAPFTDNSDERRADLAGRLESLKHVIESAGIGIFFWDIVRDSIRWSDRHYTIFGWPEGILVTHAMFRNRIHPDDIDVVDAAVNAALLSGNDYATNFRICLDDASIRYIRGSGRVELGVDGRAISVSGAVVDVTEVAQAEIAMHQRESELAAIAMYLPDIIARFDCEHRCTFMSPSIEALTRHPASFYVGKKCRDFGVPYLVGTRWDVAIDGAQRDGQIHEFDFNYVGQDGCERFFITRILPSFGPSGRVESMLTVASDHTERERDARQMRDDGAALIQADLRKNEYLATLAHELRGPLAPISSAAQLIRFSNDRQVRDNAREVIERQVTQLAQLVNDLMEVGRISSGKLEIERKLITVQEVINRALETTRPLFSQKKQLVTSGMQPIPIWIDGDSMRLTQVFSNILTNASKYSATGSPVSIEARVEGDKVSVQISDEGIGLSATSMEGIFDLFVQVHATGVHAQGGLGIGLSLVKQLVELHGGTVGVSSDGAGKGSSFTVTLPRVQDLIPDPEAVSEVQVLAFPPLTVMIVDDNVDGASTLGLLLEALGHTAVLAFNGLDALKLAAETHIDLMFLDLGLPDISGVQVALRIRATSYGRELPLIALTGLGRDEDRYLTNAAQFNEHITKPLQISDLLRITQAVASKQHVGPGT